ncbi:zona pellucida sperm-binding protein 3 receptor-like [Zootoca vivipara]|uniref:zona pellucida sperm-binding protein 3 receptor-like n=1 Tax=Zootoca vivipara TaxID=8524 RepID=UPI001590FF42|nr:zona pellucida sperm-binding protein 3 receptor-like [Zootoca vivipara]
MQRPSWRLLRALWLMGISIVLLPQWSLPHNGAGFFCATPPSILHGFHNGTGDPFYALGIVITYTCSDNFSLIGANSIYCGMDSDTKGVWKGNPPECKVVKCEDPVVKHGLILSGFGDSYTYGNTITFECKIGYFLTGNYLIKCEANSSWYPALPSCKKSKNIKFVFSVRTSPDIYYLSIPNAKIIWGKKTSYEPGDKVTVQCSAGYTLSGPSEIRYIGGKQWSPELPSCYLSFVFVLLIFACLLVFLWLPAQSLYTTLCSK